MYGLIDEMAVRQRIFNSTSPFTGTSQVELKGSFQVSSAIEQDTEDEDEDGNKNKINLIKNNPLLRKLWTCGTAEQIGEGPLKPSSFIAQAECETQDSQEFSPSYSECYVPSPNCFISSHSSEPNNVASPAAASVQELSNASIHHHTGKKSRKKRKGKKKFEKKKGERHRQRVPSGVPEQESGSSLPWMQEETFSGRSSDLSSSCCSSVECSEVQNHHSPFYCKPVYNTSSAVPWTTPDPACRFLSSYRQEIVSDSSSSIGDCSLALAGLRGSVSQGDPCFAGPFFKDLEQDVREQEDELSTFYSDTNEGLIFYKEEIQPIDSEYREGREYIITDFIKEGSYGEVHTVQDVNTGFKFAAKKIALKRFNSEEVGAWSALKSSRVVELFGVVREGPNVVLFMDLKAGSLGQLISERGRLPEDLSLHYQYQVFTGLEYLVKKKVAHLDIKADNVLLSADGRDTFLCDFGHAEKLDKHGQSICRSREMKGTETHMAPEIVKCEPRGAKADVWSSCCMFLHMLNGCHPWTRYYTCRLCLKIAKDPPPLGEIPPDCSPFTVDVFKAGLHKDPVKRASASELKVKTALALKEVGGLKSPPNGPYTEPLYNVTKPPDTEFYSSAEDTDKHPESDNVWTLDKPKSGIGDKDTSTDLGSLLRPQSLFIEPQMINKITTLPELELRKLERDFYLSSLSQLHSAEMQEQLLSCISSDYSNREQWDKKDSGRWSLSPADDFSSGVFSYNSQPDGQVFSLDFLGHSQFPPPCCFEGVDVRIKDFNRRNICIREARRVKVGHIATGISDQISERVFTLETHMGQQIAHDEEVLESGLELCCVSAPDFSQSWQWRVKDGLLETR